MLRPTRRPVSGVDEGEGPVHGLPHRGGFAGSGDHDAVCHSLGQQDVGGGEAWAGKSRFLSGWEGCFHEAKEPLAAVVVGQVASGIDDHLHERRRIDGQVQQP